MVRKAGKDSVRSSQGTRVILFTISAPTMMRAGDVIGWSRVPFTMIPLPIKETHGEKKRATRNQKAVTTAVIPVLPPSLTPVALST